MPSGHPPTLFLHGSNDLIVPPGGMIQYGNALEADGVEVNTILDENAGHEWLQDAVTAVPDWFLTH